MDIHANGFKITVNPYGANFVTSFQASFAGGKQWVETANKLFFTYDAACKQAREWAALPVFQGRV